MFCVEVRGVFLVQKEMSKSHLMTARENTWNDERRLFSLLHTGYIHFNRTCTFSYLQANDSFSNFFYFDNTCVKGRYEASCFYRIRFSKHVFITIGTISLPLASSVCNILNVLTCYTCVVVYNHV